MKILLKQVLVATTTSTYANKIVDIAVVNGIITMINATIPSSDDFQEIDCSNCYITNGWVDIFCQIGEPGLEAKETIESIANAAFEGGITTLFALPNTNPIIDNKSLVVFAQSHNKTLPVTILPYGSITKHTDGKQLAEMYDMHQAGAIAFSDGILPLQTAGVMLKALQYVKAFDGVLVQLPINKSIGAKGVMNEGVVSVQLGLPGIPSIAEELLLKRDIDLLNYTQSKLHITGVSTKESIELIKNAKLKGLQITCSCTPYHLLFCQDDLEQYDTNLKFNPPLRTKEDRQALIKAVEEGVIDCITSHHLPEIIDNKVCDFIEAAFGAIGVQTSFNTLLEAIPSLTADKISSLMVDNAASIFKLNLPTIEVGNACNVTIFSTTSSWQFTLKNNKSKAINSPFFNKTFKGKVVATLNNNQIFINTPN